MIDAQAYAIGVKIARKLVVCAHDLYYLCPIKYFPVQTEKFEIIAKTFQGLEGVLANEITALGGSNVTIGRRMVSFEGDKALLYKANLACRTALRILKPILHFEASNPDEVYNRLRNYNWEELMGVTTTFSIDSVVFSDEFRHSKFVTYRMKDAIADYFNERYGKRPSVRLTNADVQFNLHINNTSCTLSLDSSGESLHKRGYREAQTEAPINEVLAAGLIMLSGWHGECSFIDPMCGSGTFLIEAALIATNTYPGIFRQHFAFEKWPDFDADLLEELYNDESNEREFEHKIYGSDISVKAIAIAERNIKSAGVGRYIELSTRPIQSYEEAPATKGIIITNPPYGERIAANDMEALYEAIGNRLKHVFKGYTAWVLGYKQEHFDKIGLKPSAKIPTLNGALECEFRKYDIFEGTYAAHKKATATEPPKPRPMRSKDKPRRDDKKPFGRRSDKRGDRDEKKTTGSRERNKPFARENSNKEKSVRPTRTTASTQEGRMPKKTTAGSRTRKRNNNDNK